jgi:hypothetical protein
MCSFGQVTTPSYHPHLLAFSTARFSSILHIECRRTFYTHKPRATRILSAEPQVYARWPSTSSMAPRKDCPQTETEWSDEFVARGIVSIHEIKDLSSASKIKVDQFLALKVIWRTERDFNQLKDAKWASRFGTTHAKISETREHMSKSDGAWKLYLDSIPNDLKPNDRFSEKLGRFALVLQNQKIVRRLKEGSDEHVQGRSSPIGTRAQKQAAIDNAQAPRSASRDLSVDAGIVGAQQGRSSSGRRVSPVGSDDSKANSDATINSGVDFTLPKAVRDAMADEQVVNTAAISFLQSLFVCDGSQQAYWSSQRKGFAFGKSKFKALVDGHLQIIGESRSAAILEVKARRRPPVASNDFKIEWQESAQMALWIREEPSSYWTDREDRDKCR